MIRRILCLILAVGLLSLTAFAEEDILVAAIPGTQSVEVNAKGAIVMEAQTGRVLFEQNAHDRLPIASTTKIMTALITLEQPDLDTVFEVDPEAIVVEGSSMGLQKGDKASLRTLATGMLLASGNDGANAAAVRISGSTEAFVEAMNLRAAEIGMENTSFETPSGLDGDNHYSTAYDMALLTQVALQNEEFTAICSQYKMRLSYGNPPYDRWLTNHNKLLNYYEGTIGVKTGFTKKAGRCLVTAARRDGVTLICVTLGCPSDWTVHQNLYDRYFGELQVEDLAAGIPQVSVPVTGGTSPEVAASALGDPLQVPVPVGGAEVEYRVSAQPFLYAPVEKGQAVGQVEILLDGQVIETREMVTAEEIPLLHEYEEDTGLLDLIGSLFS